MKSEFQIVTLQNGLRCVHRRVARPVAHLSLTIGAGTRDELPHQHGVAHLVEHLLFKGTSNHRAHYINSALDAVGGELNAFTAKEETVLHATCLRQYAKKGAHLLLDMALNSTFSEVELEKEKEVIIDEINSYKDAPAELIFDEFEELLFGSSPLGRSILGDKRSLKRVKKSDLQAFCADNYSLDNMIFALSSSHTSSQFEAFCNSVFGALSTQNKRVNRREAPSREKLFAIVKNKRLSQTHTAIGGYSPSMYDDRRLPTALLFNVLGGLSALSRMNLELRERHALTYNAEAAFCPFTDAGLFTLYFSCEANKSEKAERILKAELHKLMDKPFTDRELSKHKKQLIGQMLIANDNNESSIIAVAKSLLLYGVCETTEDIITRIEAVNAEEIQSIARELFSEENLYKLSYR